jgi:uncharacterized membrane protein
MERILNFVTNLKNNMSISVLIYILIAILLLVLLHMISNSIRRKKANERFEELDGSLTLHILTKFTQSP